MSDQPSPGRYAPRRRRAPTLRCDTSWVISLVLLGAWLIVLLFLFSTKFHGLFSARHLEEAHEEGPAAIEEQENSTGGFVTKRQLQDLALRYQREGIIIFLVCNLGYFDFFENWAAHARLLGLDKHFLAIAEDAESYQFLEEHWPGHGVRFRVEEMDEEGDVQEDKGGQAVDINSQGFKRIMYRRVFYLRALLASGLGVLLCDVDTFFLKDPFPYFRGAYDLFGVVEIPDAFNFNATDTFLRVPKGSMFLCGGFLLFKDTPYAWLILDHLLLNIFRSDAKTSNRMNDQTFLHAVLQDLYWKIWEFRPRIGILPQQLFPPGWLFFRNEMWRQENKDSVVWVHNNWVPGKEFKVLRYQRLNLWKVKGTLEPNKYCSLASTCDAEQRQMLGLPMASGAQAQAQTRSKPEGKRGLSTNSNQPDEIHPFLGDPDLLLNDVTSTRYLVQGLRWGSHSAQDVAALPDGFIVFCIPLEGEFELLQSWVGSLEAVGISSHFLLVALTQKLYSLFEATWPGHSILLGPQVQQVATAAARRHAEAAAAAASAGRAEGTPAEQVPGPGEGRGAVLAQAADAAEVGDLVAEEGGGPEAVGAFHSAPSVATMSTPMLLLALQPYVLKALLGLVGSNAAVFYSEVDSVFVKNAEKHIPTACSVLVATEEPIQAVENVETAGLFSPDANQKQKNWQERLKGTLPVTFGRISVTASTKAFIVKASPYSTKLVDEWVRLVRPKWTEPPSLAHRAEAVARNISWLFTQALRAVASQPVAPGKLECNVGVLPRHSFPPDSLVFHNPQWLKTYHSQIVLVRNDQGRAKTELMDAYRDLGLLAV